MKTRAPVVVLRIDASEQRMVVPLVNEAEQVGVSSRVLVALRIGAPRERAFAAFVEEAERS